jgi:glycosyltransferase involved in cell wall biosynthesis
MPFHQIGGGQLHQALLAQVLTASYDVDLVHHVPGLTHAQLARDYDLDLSGVNVRYVDPIPTVWPFAADKSDTGRRGFAAHRKLTEPYDLFVDVVVGPPIRSYARRGVLVALFPFVGRNDVWPWLDPAGPSALRKAIRNAHYGRTWRAIFGSYQRCIANSCFTARWIRTRWGIDAEVVYPPVRARFDDRPKTSTILSVGRFSRRGTQKKQLEMVTAFTRAHAGLFNGWEYLCLGGVADDDADRGYYEEVCEAAKGYSVQVVCNPAAGVVKEAYERAAVFWHAAGYAEDEQRHPERSEHFGMSTVEAMAAGCVPVVIRKGGQPEIVEHGASGFLWDTMDELIHYTHQLTSAPQLRNDMAGAARARARVFTDLDAFAARMLSLVGSER